MRVLSLASQGGTVVANEEHGVRAKVGLRGTGLPPVQTQWFEGAGDGATYRGGRVLPRVMDMPLKVYGPDRRAVAGRLSLLGRIFAPTAGPVRMTVELDGEPWYTDVRRTGGGDWEWGVDTDGATFVMTVLTVQAGDPYWTRRDAESRLILPGGLGRGLIKDTSLSKLQVSSSTALGEVQFSNSGDVPAHATWVLRAPFSGFELVSPTGQRLAWEGLKEEGHIEIDTRWGTVKDEAGVNHYGGLDTAPAFWRIPAGESKATVQMNDAVTGSRAEVFWRVQRWVMF